ncbi:MAG: glycosyltransferase [Pseudomonadota bacterium]
MAKDTSKPRVLIYSHDTFGLGHLRRCRAIAHSLVESDKDVSVLILSGSPIIGSFDFRARVDFVRIPGVIKLRNGEYTSLNLHIDTEQTMAMRESIIMHTADIFDPDLFIVDKEPLGLRGEVKSTLEMLRDRGTPLVLGLRDVMDDPGALAKEWERKDAVPALTDLYSQIWVYGLPQICDPLDGIDVPPSVRKKTIFTGYLPREEPQQTVAPTIMSKLDGPFILVTAGGGGDGDAIFDWVLKAYEHDKDMPLPAALVLGPFMQSDLQAEYMRRAEALPNVEAIAFDARIESLMVRAAGVVGMGGYNTFCEILSFDKPSLIVPRTVPRLEQFIRATRARDLGLISVLVDDEVRSPEVMATALRHLLQQNRPSDVVIPGLLDGLSNVNKLTQRAIDGGRAPQSPPHQKTAGNASPRGRFG